MTIKKIQDILSNISKKHQIDFKIKIDEVLSICDSQIEQLMLLQLYNYFQNYKDKGDYFPGFSEINFIEHGFYDNYIGFKVKKKQSESSTNPYNTVFREFEIYPQFETIIDEKNYRLDIAIILNRIKNNEIIDTRKIALECDGYDYDSSPEKKKSDYIRTRKLKTNGWKEVFRYSGSEIYRIKEIEEVHSNFEEIIKMLMI